MVEKFMCPQEENYQFLSSPSEHSREKTCLHRGTPRIPTSPWMPISMLFAAISTKVTPQDMDLANFYYEKFKVCCSTYIYFPLFFFDIF